jgi:isopropylmalate/homocitrate/citramalate synthase
VTSFVRPGAIPQLADAEQVVANIEHNPDVRYTALVPNAHGMERAARVARWTAPDDMKSRERTDHDVPKDGNRGRALQGIAVFTAASETFSQKNTNAGIAETLVRFEPVIAEARAASLWVRGYVSTAFGCPFEGEVSAAAVVNVAGSLIELGVDEVAVSDTIGVATPKQVEEIVDAVRSSVDVDRIALHFHDTRGTALANVLAGLLLGVTTFDASAGGLGGCPYAPGAAGNLATEDLVYMLEGLNVETGVDLAKLVAASRYLAEVTGRLPASRYFQAAIA